MFSDGVCFEFTLALRFVQLAFGLEHLNSERFFGPRAAAHSTKGLHNGANEKQTGKHKREHNIQSQHKYNRNRTANTNEHKNTATAHTQIEAGAQYGTFALFLAETRLMNVHDEHCQLSSRSVSQ